MLGLTTITWYGILEMAQEYGWNPMGTILPQWQVGNIGFLGFGDLDERPMAYLSLTFDHRILDGAIADYFLTKIVETLQNWG
jgi:pyruvate/2-oxoglutarate dehydrogenase complex dihydrolipoamide acyltransferase (E2) component